MTNEEAQGIVRAAALLLVDSALDLIQRDPHQWSGRGCMTCRTISNLVGRPFGCELHRKQHGASPQDLQRYR